MRFYSRPSMSYKTFLFLGRILGVVLWREHKHETRLNKLSKGRTAVPIFALFVVVSV